MFVELGREVFLRPAIDDQHAFAVAAHLLFAFRQFPFLYFDVVLFGKEAKRIIIRKLLMLHNEVNSRTPFAAGKAFTDILCWRHIERGGLVAMERTQPYIVYASFPKGNEFGNNVHNVCSIQYPVYGSCLLYTSDAADEL